MMYPLDCSVMRSISSNRSSRMAFTSSSLRGLSSPLSKVSSSPLTTRMCLIVPLEVCSTPIGELVVLSVSTRTRIRSCESLCRFLTSFWASCIAKTSWCCSLTLPGLPAQVSRVKGRSRRRANSFLNFFWFTVLLYGLYYRNSFH